MKPKGRLTLVIKPLETLGDPFVPLKVTYAIGNTFLIHFPD